MATKKRRSLKLIRLDKAVDEVVLSAHLAGFDIVDLIVLLAKALRKHSALELKNLGKEYR